MKKMTWLIVLCVLIALGAIGGFSAFYLTRAPAEAARTFLQYISDNNWQGAYNSFSEPESGGTVEYFKNSMQKAGDLNGLRDITLNNRAIKGKVATIKGTITRKDGVVIPVKIVLVKEDGGWKLIEANISPREAEE